MKLTFDRERHEYRLDNVKIPSVTQIINPFIDLSHVPGDVLIHAQDFGLAVHLACSLFDNNDLDESSVDDAIRPYLMGWQKFREESKCKILANEQIVASETLRVGGTIDRVLKLWGNIAILDIKTGIEKDTEGLQTAAYQYLWNQQSELKAVKRYTLHFPEGKPILREWQGLDDLPTFMALVQVRNYALKHGINHYYWSIESEELDGNNV